MGYTDPETIHNPATNTIAPAAWGDAVDAAVQWINDLHCRAAVSHSTTFSLATSGTAAALPYDTEARDVGGMHSTVTNNSRITVPAGAAGDYRISATVEFAANATGYRTVTLRKNGATTIAVVRVPATATLATVITCTRLCVSMAVGDYIEVLGTQLSGGALNVTGSTSSTFEMEWAGT